MARSGRTEEENSIKQDHHGTEHHNITHNGHTRPSDGFIRHRCITFARTVKNALTAFKTVRQWLQTQHSFYGQDGDPIQCTGWQFVGYNIIAAVVAILLCIEY